MNFSNQNVSPDKLPTVTDVVFRPLEKDYLTVKQISLSITLFILFAIAALLFYFIDSIQLPIIIYPALALFILFSVFLFLSTGFSFKYSGYALREKDLLYRSGWLTRKERVAILNRVQHVSVQSGPFERKFGLSAVSIFTAGASEADFTIKGITKQTAQNIKEWISTKQNDDLNQ